MNNDNVLSNNLNDKLGVKSINVLNVKKVKDYLFIELDNDQRILTNGNELYDVSDYNNLYDLFNMGNRLCAKMKKGYSTYVVDLKTKEILFESDKVNHISKQDDKNLHVIIKNSGINTMYDVETKKYLPYPKNYEFEHSLGNNLYVFKEENNFENNFYDYKRCVINADGKIILKDIDGWIDLYKNYLIINKRNELCIVKINKDNSLNMNTITKSEEMLAKPKYYNGHIIILEKGLIKIFTPDLNLVNQFEIKELESVIDSVIVSNILKLCLPHTIDEKIVNKHLFMNLKTGKSISHVRIDGYPLFTPDVFVGKDDLNDEHLYYVEHGKTYKQTEYHFYDSDFNEIADVKGNGYSEIDDTNFVVGTWDGRKWLTKYINAKTGVVKECDYDVINFLPDNKYGYALNNITDAVDIADRDLYGYAPYYITDKMDIVDRDLNIIFPNIEYNRFDLDHYDFTYFVVNDYVCTITHIADGPESFFINRFQNADGKIFLRSIEHKCYPIGNLIQIIRDEKTEFLNTLTGEIGQLSLTAPTDEDGKIKDLTNVFQSKGLTQLLFPSSDEQPPKVKKLIPNTKKDD